MTVECSLAPVGWLRGYRPHDVPGATVRVHVRHLRGPCRRPAHPHHRQVNLS